MNLLAKQTDEIILSEVAPIIVVGTGPVGIQFIKSLLSDTNHSLITVFGNEPWEPYNRVKLSSFFAGQLAWDELVNGQKLPNSDSLVVHHNCAITDINRESKTVTDELGQIHPYSKLIIATGSSPHIPTIPGIDLNNIFTFRNMSDIERLLARRTRSRTTAVIGGGVLGIEAAKAMSRENTEVIIIDHSLYLMSNQLDEQAAELLREYLLLLGIKIYLGHAVKNFIGDGEVEIIQLNNGREIECDTVILTTGIKPNVALARKARLSVGRGIRVNDAMQTSDEDIYAIGECAEHRGKIYGVVKPGYEQAKVAAFSLSETKANYAGSLSATQIKVIDIPVFSMGDVEEVSVISNKKEYVFTIPGEKIYRKIIIKNHRLVGAISVGEWDEQGRVQETILNKRFIWPWSLKRFVKTGNIWPEENSADINQWPASALVCNCTGVTRGQLSIIINSGCDNLTEICSQTGASSVCGSCRPLISQMLSGQTKLEPVKGSRSLLLFGFLSAVLILLSFLLPENMYSDSVQVFWQWDELWRDNLYKQISGFSLLALSVVALLLSLRKRIEKFSFSTFPVWRIIHVLVGFFAVVGIAVHSGYQLGHGFNYYLSLSFFGILLAGGISSLIVALEHKFDVALSRKLKSNFVWLHILAFWPFPVLLAVHVFKTYYF